MDTIKTYDLHKDDYSKLHFEIKDAKSYFDINKKHASIPHRHSFYQVIWFKQAGRHYVDYEVIDHDANTIFFINRNQIHYFCTDALNEGYLFHFNDHFINKGNEGLMDRLSLSIFNEIGSSCLKLSKEDSKKISLLTSFIESEILTKDNYYKEQVYHYFQNILFQIERMRKLDDNLDVQKNSSYILAAEFKKLVFEEIESFHSMDFFAHKLGTNTKTLTEVSKEFLLDTPANIIRQSKLLEAKRMLSNQSTSIKEVAYGLGFDAPTYFTKYFKKGTSYTPKQFQKAYL
ncbi:AraC family transcriptional regulator [Aquimarina sp. 2201CG14-23]|uniref:AraC family transcriptional regulator n=1 Tax=Aquimarina mycalae TaxID=3040073 RepID=UPI0024781A06|nr:helix-turn-helix transcriptional regulator [Aquimarina sp. 2201CG14-23]MDH7445963.1 helix-turn-helix transcriptional regulator [Aquimarina sp. 2201CG14-23]